MDNIYNRMRRLLPVATNVASNKQHPKNRAIQISFVEWFVLLLLKSGVWQLIMKVLIEQPWLHRLLNIVLVMVLISAHVKRFSVSQMS